jgi:hypothetical protein
MIVMPGEDSAQGAQWIALSLWKCLLNFFSAAEKIPSGGIVE